MNSMESWRQRGLTAEKGHKIAWQTYNGVEEREKKKELYFNFKLHSQK